MYSLILLLSELLPHFISIFSPHIDGNRWQMMCKLEQTLAVPFRAKLPFFFLLPQFIFNFSLHIDRTQRQMLCTFQQTLVVTFRANWPFFFLGTAADAKAQPFVMTYPSNPTCTH